MLTKDEVSTEKVSKEDILKNFKIPERKGRNSLEVVITVNPKYNTLAFSKGMLFKLGMPKRLAVSIANGKIFVIPNNTLDDITSYTLRKSSNVVDSENLITNKGLIQDIQLTLDKLDGMFDLVAKLYMEIGENTVYELLVKDEKT